jgi:DNA modification methylase
VSLPTWAVLEGDCLARMATLDAGSVRCCVTSPPYWGLRDYGIDGQIGLEETPAEYVAKMVAVFAEVRRVLADDGTCWVNLGDSYASGGMGRRDDDTMPTPKGGHGIGATPGYYRPRPLVDGLKPKDLCGIPWRVAFALQADGWYLRSDIIWAKPNPMPESVTDRPTKAHEYVFLLSKAERYFYDADAIREPAVYGEILPTFRGSGRYTNNRSFDNSDGTKANTAGMERPTVTHRNRRTVWTIPTAPYAEAHFATYPPALVEPCILAGSARGDVVLDPFCGSGTTGMVALRHGRGFVGVELSPKYAAMARSRILYDAPLLNRLGAG